MKPKISIIIPVYQVEQYLRRCLDSVLCQTMQDIEIILINDGSSDHSGIICDEYAARDARVTVIHQENAGASAARNRGLAIASSDYIGYVDADDCIAPNMFEQLYLQAEKTHADIAMCEYIVIDGNQNRLIPEINIEDDQCRILDTKKAFELICDFGKTINVAIWNKLFRKEVVQNLSFDPGMRVCHDLDYLSKALTRSKKVVYLPFPLYGYFKQRPGALTNRADHDNDLTWNIDSYHNDISKAMEEFIRDNPEMKKLAVGLQCNGDMNAVKSMIRAGKTDEKTYGIIQTHIRKNLFTILTSELRMLSKIQMLVYSISPDFFRKMYINLKKSRINRKWENKKA